MYAKNIIDITKIKSEMKLYGIGEKYFDTPEELNAYCSLKNLNSKNTHTIEYIRSLAEQDDIIKRTEHNGRIIFHTVVNEDSYCTFFYNNKELIQGFNYGQIRELYNPFRERGIVFENDIYAKLDNEMEKVLAYCKKNNIFNMGNNKN